MSVHNVTVTAPVLQLIIYIKQSVRQDVIYISTVGNDQSPPLVITAVTGKHQADGNAKKSQHYQFPHTHSETRVSVEDVHLHLPHAASCTLSLILPNSSRRQEAAVLTVLINLTVYSPAICSDVHNSREKPDARIEGFYV